MFFFFYLDHPSNTPCYYNVPITLLQTIVGKHFSLNKMTWAKPTYIALNKVKLVSEFWGM